MNNSKPTLSVIMPNYNHSKFIKQALDALVKQTLSPKEIIIIDDASTDNSLEIISEFEEKYPYIKLYKNDHNQGVVFTLNRGLTLSTGDYVLFTAADDVLFPDFNKKTMDQFSLHPKAGLCSARTRIINSDGIDVGPHKSICVKQSANYITPFEADKIFTNIGNWIQSNTTVYRRDYLSNEGGFPDELKSYADSYINIIIALKYGACFIPEYLGCWRRLLTSFSQQNSMNSESYYRIIEDTKEFLHSKNTTLITEGFINSWEKQMICQFLIDSMEGSVHKCQSLIEKLVNKEKSAYKRLVLLLAMRAIKISEIFLKIMWVLLLKPRYFIYYLKRIFVKEVA